MRKLHINLLKYEDSCIWLIQWNKIKSIWLEKNIFGIEKWISRIIPLFRYISISFYISCIINCIELKCCKKNRNLANKFIDLYIILKILFVIFLLFIQILPCSNIYIFYLLIETLTILIEVFLITDYTKPPVSIKRSILILFINFQEMVLYFAVLYLYYNAIENIKCSLQAIYFSYSVAMTLGFGDFNAQHSKSGKILVIIQLIITSIFIFMLFSYFLSRYKEKNH